MNQNSEGLLTLKNELEIPKFVIFDIPMPKFRKSYEEILIVIFDQWSKLYLGFNAEAEIQIFNGV